MIEVGASLPEHHVQKYGMSQHCTGAALAPLPRLKKAAVSKNSCHVWNSHCTWIPTTCHPPSIPSTPTHSLLSPATQLTTERLLHYISARTALEAILQNAALFNRAFPLGHKEYSDMARPSNQHLRVCRWYTNGHLVTNLDLISDWIYKVKQWSTPADCSDCMQSVASTANPSLPPIHWISSSISGSVALQNVKTPTRTPLPTPKSSLSFFK